MARKLGLKTTGIRKALLAANATQTKRSLASSVNTNQIEKPIGGTKNGGKRILTKIVPPKQKSSKTTTSAKQAKLRSSVVPGSVLIVLAGRFRGKRVVFLKQLSSGLLLVTGPYKINGVPLSRISQSYVISTSTKIDISSVTVPETINDTIFKTKKASKSPSFIPENAMDIDEKSNTISPIRREAQKSVDMALISIIKKTPMLSAYLRSTFSLNKGEAPHSLTF